MKSATYNELYTEGIPVISGKIEGTEEKCKMQSNGFWIGANGKHITSYIRVDKNEPEGIERQYSMDRSHRFWIETEDKI